MKIPRYVVNIEEGYTDVVIRHEVEGLTGTGIAETTVRIPRVCESVADAVVAATAAVSTLRSEKTAPLDVPASPAMPEIILPDIPAADSAAAVKA
jgi:hypothetical protein